jgi:hypothetical protein
MRGLLDKVSNPAVVLIVLVLGILVNGFLYFYYNRDSDQRSIVEEKRGPPRAEGVSPGTPKKDAAHEVGRGGAVGGDRGEASPVREAGPHPPQPAPASSGASLEGGLPVGTSVAATAPAPQATAPPPTAPPATAPPATAIPTATASSTAAATAQYAQYATAPPTALPP